MRASKIDKYDDEMKQTIVVLCKLTGSERFKFSCLDNDSGDKEKWPSVPLSLTPTILCQFSTF